MSMLPISRVSTLMQSYAAVSSIDDTQQQLQTVQNEISTGKQVNVPSDNPSSAAIIQQLQNTLGSQATYQTNLQQAGNQLGETESTLTSVTTLLQQAQTIASANVGTTFTPAQRQSAAQQVQAIENQMMSLANTTYGGLYLFGGDGSNQQPFVSSDGGVQYVGGSSVLTNAVDANSYMPLQISGASVFGATSTRMQGSALSPALTLTTRLSDVAGATGEGVQLGAIQIGNGAVTAKVDLSGSDTIGDVVNAINAAGIPGITAGITGGSLQIDGGGNPVTVSDVGNGTTAADLGISGSSAAGTPLVGQNVGAEVTVFTPLSVLNNGAGIDTSGLQITNGGSSASISFAGAGTVGDLLNAINGSKTGVEAEINSTGTGIDIVNTSQGTNLSIGENGGTTAADLGVRSLAPSTPLSQLNSGSGVDIVAGQPDFQITRSDGTSFSVDLTGATTIQDVINDINTADGGGGVTANFATTGNGIVLTDTSGGGGTMQVSALNASTAAADLGLTAPASGNVITGADTNPVVAEGVFSHLAQLQAALQNNDVQGITQAAQGLQTDYQSVSDINGQTGAQVQAIQSRQSQLQDENTATQSLLSQFQDTDMTSAITQYTTLQTALQASLETSARTLSVSLLDYLPL